MQLRERSASARLTSSSSMSYSKDHVSSVRLDATPSMQFNNLSVSGGSKGCLVRAGANLGLSQSQPRIPVGPFCAGVHA